MNLSTFANNVKSTLINLINEIDTGSENYVLHPGRDFTRNRKLGFLQTMLLILVLSRCSLPKELADIFKFDCTRASVPAFTQQRRKIRHEALYRLFMSLNERFPCRKLYKKKYRLLACDGTRLNCPLNKSDAESLHCLGKSPFNQQHLTALFDLMEHRFIDAVVQPLRRMNEYEALRQIVSRLRSDMSNAIHACISFINATDRTCPRRKAKQACIISAALL
ncbi:MAG: hypothetical protein LUE92_01820 [Clostridiales bacterium]|nr:hypothetical protein [Clostridiales bacterium]